MNVAFEGDTFIKEELIKLRNIFGLNNCVETGCQYGSTTLELYDVFKAVKTIEADEQYFFNARDRFAGLKITAYFGLSQKLLPYIPIPDNVLYYLDAHGGGIGGCPLKRELEVIAEKKHENVCIAIHDFKVPGHPELGYDTYDFELCFEEIAFELAGIYPAGYRYHYNDQADGAMRGIAYFYPKK